MKNNDNLKPGDRVKLTGWVNLSQHNIEHVEKFAPNHPFPFESDLHFDTGLGRTKIITVKTLTGEKWRFNIKWFTYEKIQEDGNG